MGTRPGKESKGMVPRRHSRPSLRMETSFRRRLHMAKTFRRPYEVNSHSLGGWEEALHMLPQWFLVFGFGSSDEKGAHSADAGGVVDEF
jgi:hypothetical protein